MSAASPTLKTKKPTKRKTTRSETRQIILSTAMMVLVIVLLAETLVLMKNFNIVTEAENKKHTSFLLAEELRQSFDDLTKMARTYVETANPNYADYYYEIIGIRNGEIPRPENYNYMYWDHVIAGGRSEESRHSSAPPVALKDLMIKAGFVDSEMQLLEHSQKESKNLLNLELEAFKAMEGLYKDDSGKYSRRGDPDPNYARSLLYSDQYNKARKRTLVPIEAFLKQLEKRTLEEMEKFRKREEILILAMVVTSSVTSMFAVFSIVLSATAKTRTSRSIRIMKEMRRKNYQIQQKPTYSDPTSPEKEAKHDNSENRDSDNAEN